MKKIIHVRADETIQQMLADLSKEWGEDTSTVIRRSIRQTHALEQEKYSALRVSPTSGGAIRGEIVIDGDRSVAFDTVAGEVGHALAQRAFGGQS